MTHVIVIGGGITGLAAAHRVLELSRAAQPPCNVLLVEASDRLGGVIQTIVRDGCLLESGPDSFVNEQPWAMELCQRLGLGEALLPANTEHRASFVAHAGRLTPVPEGFSLLGPTRWWPFVNTPLLSPLGKLRALGDLMLPSHAPPGDESIAAFVRRRFGREVLERLAEPLVSGMASGDPEHLSMRMVLPRFVEIERQHGSVIRGLRARLRAGGNVERSSGARYGLFVSLRGGMETLVRRLADRLPASCVRVRTAVSRLERAPDRRGWLVHVADGTILHADAVCLALPPYHAAELLRDTDAPLAQLLEQLIYTSWITINLVYDRAAIRHPLNGFGLVIPAKERLPLVGCTFSHVKFPHRCPEDLALLRAFVRWEDGQPTEHRADDAWAGVAHATLSRLLGTTAAPRFAAVHRHPRTLPQYRVGHREWVARVQQRLQGYLDLSLAGNAFSGHGITHCIRSGEAAAEMLCAHLRTAGATS